MSDQKIPAIIEPRRLEALIRHLVQMAPLYSEDEMKHYVQFHLGPGVVIPSEVWDRVARDAGFP